MFITEKRLEKIRKVLQKRQKDLQVFSDNVKNQHNFSAILRTCDAVGVLYMYYRFLGEGELINEEITMGSHKWVIHQEVEDIDTFFRNKKEEGFQIVATYLSDKSVHFREIDYTKPTLIVVGNEIHGVSKEVLKYADHNIVIPMYGMAQSLNVSVATGVILYEAQRQREERGFYNKLSLSDREMELIVNKWATEDVVKYKKQESAIRHIKKSD
ncbi:RNA methyltransferase [Persephonella sp. IF05-L8]|uniref:TrmH family RNA methyltransferase n=1 Tax=Persephonella sp. IF05-L8 TaxID=1158338 RepID=UPI000AF17CC7